MAIVDVAALTTGPNIKLALSLLAKLPEGYRRNFFQQEILPQIDGATLDAVRRAMPADARGHLDNLVASLREWK